MLASHPVDADTGSATSDSPSRKISDRPNALSRALAAGLAHHVNNPLLGVIGSLELALREVEPDSPESDHIERSLKCALQAAEAVRRLVAFAYHPVSAPAPVSLQSVAARIARRLHNQGQGHRILIRMDSDAQGLAIVNESVVELVIAQLVANAQEAMIEGGILTLNVWDEGGSCCLRIHDTGPGLSPEAQSRLFEPFFTTKGAGHLGLGLALCRDLVYGQGGRIHVVSSPCRGTSVRLDFPAAQAKASTGPQWRKRNSLELSSAQWTSSQALRLSGGAALATWASAALTSPSAGARESVA